MGPLGAQPVPKAKRGWSVPRLKAQFVDSQVWRCGTRVHACSKHVAQVGALLIYICVNLSNYYHFIT
jgi:hypothetical protein